jgi:hypothetical protein
MDLIASSHVYVVFQVIDHAPATCTCSRAAKWHATAAHQTRSLAWAAHGRVQQDPEAVKPTNDAIRSEFMFRLRYQGA